MDKNKTSQLIRLNKFLSDSGITSRRKADTLIKDGEIKVNGQTVFTLGLKIDPYSDKVAYKGKIIETNEDLKYYAFNKPASILSSTSDPEGRPVITDFFPEGERLFPVGRLDWDSEGLILVTNDGEFSQAVSHPKKEITKTYIVKLDKCPTDGQLQKLRNGVTIIGGKCSAQFVEVIQRSTSKYPWAKIIISQGKNRQIRRMFEKVGCDVKKLQRTAIGGLQIGKIKKGEYVTLSEKDIQKIFRTQHQDGAPVISKVKRKVSSKRLTPKKKTTTHKKKSTSRKPPLKNKKMRKKRF